MTQYANYPRFKGWKANGVSPAAGYFLYTYEAGTTTPKTTYNSSVLDNANANPIVLDSNGEATIFLGSGAYRFDLKTPAGALVWTFDPLIGSGTDLNAVTSIAELKALSSQGAAVVNVLGYYTSGDGGGGLFYFDASSSAADDGGITIRPASLPVLGRWKRVYSGEINVKWFGAKGDGATDDAAAIVLAATYAGQNNVGNDEGRTLLFPFSAGYYCIGSAVTFGLYTNVKFDPGVGIQGLSSPRVLTFNGKFLGSKNKHFYNNITAVFPTYSLVQAIWWGASGLGVVDEYSAITAAFASITTAGGEVYLCAGTHLTNQSIECSANNVTLCGDILAVLKAKTGGTFPQPGDNGWVYSINGFSNCKVLDITIDGNKSGNTTGRTFGIFVRGAASKIKIQNVVSQNCPCNVADGSGGLGGDGITIGQAGSVPKDIQILDCLIDSNVRTGIALIEGEDIIVDSCIIKSTAGTNLGVGLDIETDSGSSTSRNITVSNCLIYDNHGGGLNIVSRLTDNMEGISIIGNVFRGNSFTSLNNAAGIMANSHRQGLTISGNAFDYQYTAAIYLLGSANVTISGNSFKGHGNNTTEDKCIRMYSTSSGDVENVTISGNTFLNTYQSAIFLDAFLAGSGNIANISIIGNTFRDCVAGALIANTPVVWLLGDAARTISYITISGNSFRDTRGGGATNYAIGISNAGATANITTDVILGNVVQGFGAGTPYVGSASAFNLAPTTFTASCVLVTDTNKSIVTALLFWDNVNKYLGIGAIGNRNLDIVLANAGGSISARINNTSNTAGASVSLQLESGGSSTQESSILYTYTGLAAASRWTAGRRHSSGNWVVSGGADLTNGSAYAIDVDPTYNVTIPNGNLIAAKRIIASKATVASANDLTLTTGNFYSVTGTTTINRIAIANWNAGAQVTLSLASITVANGVATGGGFNILKLAGSVNFVVGANGATLTLAYDGTSWVETARTVF